METEVRILILENDIKDLFNRIKTEKELKEIDRFNNEGVRFVKVYRMEYASEKNYSNYRKLIDSLSKLYNTYKQLTRTEGKCNKEFIVELRDSLETEIESVHDLMKESLVSKLDDQYRCLSDSYIKLIDLVGMIRKENPMKLTLDKVQGCSSITTSTNDRTSGILEHRHDIPMPKFVLTEEILEQITEYIKNNIDRQI